MGQHHGSKQKIKVACPSGMLGEGAEMVRTDDT